MNVVVQIKKEVIMTTITAEQALKSKQNFSEFLENNTPVQVTSTIADYQAKSGKSRCNPNGFNTKLRHLR